MPMFDDPRQALNRLQQELLAEEEEIEEFLDEDDWLEQQIEEAKALSGYQEPRQPQVRNFANGYGTRPDPRPVQPQQRSYLSGYSGYQQERPGYRGEMKDYDEEVEEVNNSVRGLVALAILLTLGIVTVAAYWVVVLL